MAFQENAALDVTAVRALETADRTRTLWTDAERAWASRAAAEAVGEGGAPQAFLAQRARLALGHLRERSEVLPRALHALRWRPWIGTVIIIVAFLAGVAIDQIGGTHQINVLAPPVFLLLIFNITVYAILAVGFFMHYGNVVPAGPLRRAVAALAAGFPMPRIRGQFGAVVLQFAGDWSSISAALYGARSARILHLAAAALAAGLLAGLYLRGVAFEYRASWESTFLSAEGVRRLVAIMLAPGAVLIGIPVPAVSEIEAIRAPADENAARWMHLMAATVVLMVIVPRLLLALFAWFRERYRSTHLPLALDDPYFQRLLRGFRGGPVRVLVLPYSFTVTRAVREGLERLVTRVFGGSAAITIAGPVSYGGEDALATAGEPEYAGSVIGLFNATATPEREVHGAFLAAVAAHLGPAGTLVALVDESAFRARWSGETTRLEERRRAWRELCTDQKVPCAFADLAATDVAEAEAALEKALEGTAR